MTEQMKNALKGQGGGLQSISSSVADTMGNAMDTRGSKSKAADQASSDLRAMGKSPGPTVQGSSVKGDEQIKNQQTGTGDHLGLGYRKS